MLTSGFATEAGDHANLRNACRQLHIAAAVRDQGRDLRARCRGIQLRNSTHSPKRWQTGKVAWKLIPQLARAEKPGATHHVLEKYFVLVPAQGPLRSALAILI